MSYWKEPPNPVAVPQILLSNIITAVNIRANKMNLAAVVGKSFTKAYITDSVRGRSKQIKLGKEHYPHL